MLTERLKDASSEDENSDFEAEKFFDTIDWPMPPAEGSYSAGNILILNNREVYTDCTLSSQPAASPPERTFTAMEASSHHQR